MIQFIVPLSRTLLWQLLQSALALRSVKPPLKFYAIEIQLQFSQIGLGFPVKVTPGVCHWLAQLVWAPVT